MSEHLADENPSPWWNVLERAVWTAVQTAPVVAVLDAAQLGEVPSQSYLIAAAVGFVASAVKTVAAERLKALRS